MAPSIGLAIGLLWTSALAQTESETPTPAASETPTPAASETPTPAASAAPDTQEDPLAKARAQMDKKRYPAARRNLKAHLESNPKDVDALILLGQAWMAQNRTRRAMKPFYDALAIDNKRLDAWRPLAELNEKNGTVEEAARIWAQVARLANEKDAAIKSAQLYASANKHKEALGSYKMALRRGGLTAAEYKGLATTAEAAGKPAEAIAAYEALVKMEPESVEHRLALARHYRKKEPAKAKTHLEAILAVDPKQPEAVEELAMMAIAAKDVAAAKPLLAKLLEINPKHPTANFLQAEILSEEGKTTEAKAAYQAQLGIDSKHPGANERLGVILYRENNRAAANKHLSAAEEHLEGAESLTALAELRLNKKKIDEARALLVRALRADSSHKQAQVLLARSHYLQKQYDEGEKTISRCMFANPNDGPAHLLGGAIAHARDDVENAIARYSTAAKNMPLPPEDGERFADALVRSKDYARALTVAEQAIASGGDSARLYSLLAYAQYKSGDKASSRKNMEIAISKGADDPYVNLIKGESLLEAGNRKGAKAALEKVTKVDPGNDTANALLGDIALGAGQVKVAASHYRKALETNPKLHQTRGALVRALLDDDKPGRAQKELAKLEEGALPKPEVETLKGRIQHGLGNYKEAREHYDTALAADPTNYDALYHQGENYLKLPHYTKAIELLEKAKTQKPKSADVIARLAELYAETGKRDKAAETAAALESVEREEVEKRRKEIPPEEIKTVAVGRFVNTAELGEFDWIGIGVADSLTADLSKIAYLQLVERDQIEQLKAQLAEQVANEDLIDSDDSTAAELGKLAASQWMLLGSYLVAGDSVRLNARLVDVSTSKVERSASQSGGLNDLPRLQKRLALELAGELVEISEDERRSISRAFGANLESYRLTSEAKMLQYQGDVRAAQARYREAMQADSGNVQALVGMQKALQDLGNKNTVAIMDFKPVGEAPTWIGAGLPEHLSSKLSTVSGIQVVERNQVDTVKAELAFNYENEDLMDEDKLPEMGEMLSAGVLLVGSYQAMGGKIQLRARMVDISDNKNLLGEQVTGEEKDLLELQDELAKKIVYALIGAPSEDELKALETKMSLTEYQSQMEELERLRVAEAARAADGEEDTAAEEEAEAEEEIAEVSEEADIDTDDGFARRVDLALRLSDGASGFVPGLQLSTADEPLGPIFLSVLMGVASDNVLGGRPVESMSGGGEASTFLVEGGVAASYDILEVAGIGITAGVAATLGFEQYINEAGSLTADDGRRSLESDFVVNLRPYGQARYYLFDGFAVQAGAGYNVQFLNSKEGTSGSGLYLDAGIRVDTDEAPATDDSFVIGYRGKLLAPGDQATATQYVGEGGRGVLVHGLVLGTDTDSFFDGVIYAAYASADPRAGGDALRYIEAAYDATVRVFSDTRPIVNPMFRLRAGGAYLMGTAPNGAAIEGGEAIALTLGSEVGAEFPILDFFTLSVAGGYDWVISKHEDTNARLSGFTVALGASFVL